MDDVGQMLDESMLFLWRGVFTHKKSHLEAEPGKNSILHDLSALKEPLSTVTSQGPPAGVPGSSTKASLHHSRCRP